MNTQAIYTSPFLTENRTLFMHFSRKVLKTTLKVQLFENAAVFLSI